MATFRLNNINLQVDHPLFSYSSRKILKVTVEQPVDRTALTQLHQPAEVASATTLTWAESITLPGKFEVKYPFQIVSQDQGDNPEQSSSVLTGTISIRKDEGSYTGWQVCASSKKIGYLFANVDYFSKAGTKRQLNKSVDSNSSFFFNSMQVSKDNIAVTSIYANFAALGQADKVRVYLQFQLGNVHERTSIKRLQHHQYRSHEVMQIRQTHPAVNRLAVSAMVFEAELNRTVQVGRGSTSLVLQESNSEMSGSQLGERVRIEKIFLYDRDDRQVGWVSFKYIKANDESLDPRFFLQDKFNTIGDMNFRALKNSRLTISPVRGSSTLSSHIESNSKIFMPQAQRFEDPARRKKNDKIGLGHSSIDIKQLPSTIAYQVTSLGYGRKLAPVERDHSVPGVGRYQLPLLFDRYK